VMPDWETVKVLPAIVMVPVLAEPILGETVYLIVPLPVPRDPDVMLIQVTLLVAVQVQLLFVLTLTLPVPPDEG